MPPGLIHLKMMMIMMMVMILSPIMILRITSMYQLSVTLTILASPKNQELCDDSDDDDVFDQNLKSC